MIARLFSRFAGRASRLAKRETSVDPDGIVFYSDAAAFAFSFVYRDGGFLFARRTSRRVAVVPRRTRGRLITPT